MPGNNWYENANARALYPAVVSAAEQGATTTEVWQATRDAAYGQAQRFLNLSSGPNVSDDDVSAFAKQLMAGIDIQTMNGMRSSAGEFVRAHNTLLDLDTGMSIVDANSISRPPWATTIGQSGVQEQYRIRIKRSLTFHGFTDVVREEWSTYDLNGQLGTIADALDQADSLFQGADYNSRTEINGILDYVIEAV